MFTGRPIAAAPTASTEAAVSLSSVPENRTSERGCSCSSISILLTTSVQPDRASRAGPQVPKTGCHVTPKKELRRDVPAGASRPCEPSRSDLLRDLECLGLAARDEELEDERA